MLTMFKTLKLISFDINKTLISSSNDIGLEYLKHATKFGLIDPVETSSTSTPGSTPKPDNQTVAKLNQSFQANYHKLNQTHPNFGLKSNLTTEEWWHRLIASTFHDAGYPQVSQNQPDKFLQLTKFLFKQYSRGNCWRLNPDARDLMSELRRLCPHVQLAVASNFDERLETILRDLDIRHYFHFMFVSRQCGLAKPDPQFFRHILTTVEVNPEEYLHVGDDLQNDYFPVRSLKANGMILDPTLEVKKVEGVDEANVIPDLKFFLNMVRMEQEEQNNKN